MATDENASEPTPRKYNLLTQNNIADIEYGDELRQRYAAGVSENGITFRTGNIESCEVDAIVCPWVTENPNHGFYSQRIYDAGGSGLHDELQRTWPNRLPATNSILTGSHGIKSCKHIIHVREPQTTKRTNEREDAGRYWSPHKVKPLKDCITASLIMAVSLGCRTIAIPPLGIRRMRNPDTTLCQPPAGGATNSRLAVAENLPDGAQAYLNYERFKWPAEIAAQTVLETLGEFRARSPFRDRLQEVIILFHDIDDMGGEEFAAYRRERYWSVKWLDRYENPHRLQGMRFLNRIPEQDQRESEKTGPYSSQSNFPDNSNLESVHESDGEPVRSDYPTGTSLELLESVYETFVLPLGVYVQFDNLLLPDALQLLDKYQPAVYGYLRYCPANAGNKYDGWEVDISATGRTGKWILGARVTDGTMDGRLVGRPLDRNETIAFDDPRLRLLPPYHEMLNPDLPATRRALVGRYLRDLAQREYIEARERWRVRHGEELRASRFRRNMRRRYRHLRRRRNRRRRERIKRRRRGELVPSPSPNSSMLSVVRPADESSARSRRKGLVRKTFSGPRTPEIRTESSYDPEDSFARETDYADPDHAEPDSREYDPLHVDWYDDRRLAV